MPTTYVGKTTGTVVAGAPGPISLDLSVPGGIESRGLLSVVNMAMTRPPDEFVSLNAPLNSWMHYRVTDGTEDASYTFTSNAGMAGVRIFAAMFAFNSVNRHIRWDMHSNESGVPETWDAEDKESDNHIPIYLLTTFSFSGTAPAITLDPSLTLVDEAVYNSGSANASFRHAAALGPAITDKILPATSISFPGEFGSWGARSFLKIPDNILSTVATLDHDLVIGNITGITPDQHHDEVHALNGPAHLGGLYYKTGISPVISDGDFATPVDGMVAITYDTRLGIRLMWARSEGIWKAVEA